VIDCSLTSRRRDRTWKNREETDRRKTGLRLYEGVDRPKNDNWA